MSEEKSSGSWWQTIPGVLTAAGTVIVALTGLLGTLHQSGLLGASDLKESPHQVEAPPGPSPTPPMLPTENTLAKVESVPATASTAVVPPRPDSSTPAEETATAEWLTAAEQKQEFKKWVQQGFYPREVEGKCMGGDLMFRTDWKRRPPETAFASFRNMTQDGFKAKSDKLGATGYRLESVNNFKDCEGVDRYQATWVKR